METATVIREKKFCRLDLKSVEADGTFEGYASLFHREDLGRDVVAPGAFQNSLAKRGAAGIKMLFQHDPNEPIGVWDTLREDARGLYAAGRIMAQVERGREVLALMREGAIDGLSIGFRTVKARRDARSGVRRLMEIDLWEISVVTFPMQPEARARLTKSWPFAEKLPSERECERWLTRDAGLSRSEARALMRGGLAGLRSLRDAGGGSGVKGGGLAGRITAAAHLMRRL
jgi:uncharacterized protein